MKAHLDHYRIFCIAASERSFSRAAGQLYISQSAVSQCISQLESDLQTYSNNKERLSVTSSAGENLLKMLEERCDSMQQEIDELDLKLRDIRKEQRAQQEADQPADAPEQSKEE